MTDEDAQLNKPQMHSKNGTEEIERKKKQPRLTSSSHVVSTEELLQEIILSTFCVLHYDR
jgi:hypothetical protein